MSAQEQPARIEVGDEIRAGGRWHRVTAVKATGPGEPDVIEHEVVGSRRPLAGPSVDPL